MPPTITVWERKMYIFIKYNISLLLRCLWCAVFAAVSVGWAPRKGRRMKKTKKKARKRKTRKITNIFIRGSEDLLKQIYYVRHRSLFSAFFLLSVVSLVFFCLPPFPPPELCRCVNFFLCYFFMSFRVTKLCCARCFVGRFFLVYLSALFKYLRGETFASVFCYITAEVSAVPRMPKEFKVSSFASNCSGKCIIIFFMRQNASEHFAKGKWCLSTQIKLFLPVVVIAWCGFCCFSS